MSIDIQRRIKSVYVVWGQRISKMRRKEKWEFLAKTEFAFNISAAELFKEMVE